MKLATSTFAAIYKSLRQIELVFKWIKQNLKIKSSPAPARMQY
jgi:IS4 transposase